MGTLGIISLVLLALSSIGQGVSSWISQKKANKFNEQQYEDWKSYNTPAAQMERLGQAGLNPYMVNGVNNTLSQPFAIGQNTGLSEMFSNMSLNLNRAFNAGLSEERNQIGNFNAVTNRINSQTKKTEAEIHQQLADMRKTMVDLAVKRNDPMMALLWGQANYQQIQNGILDRSADSIVLSRQYDAALAEQKFNFLDKMYPMELNWYESFQRARVNQMLASANLAKRQASHLDWLEPFQREMFLHNAYMDFKNFYQGKSQFNSRLGYDYDRLGLSRNYYDLAVNKYWRDLVYNNPAWSFLAKRPLFRTTKGGAGQFPTWTEYEYGW